MKKLIQFLSLAVLLVLFAACSKSSSSAPQKTATPPAQTKTDTAATYTTTASLHLAFTNDDLQSEKRNLARVTGSGANSTYRIVYAFNSGNNQAFEVLNSSQDFSYPSANDCSLGQTTTTLIGPHSSREVLGSERVGLESNTDYKLQVDVKSTCESVAIDYDILAWAGSWSVDPELAILCKGKTVITNDMLSSTVTNSSAVFFTQVGILTGFSSLLKNREYVGLNTYCGEAIEGSNAKCSGNELTGFSDLPSPNPVANGYMAQCSASKKPNQNGNFSFYYNSQKRAASLKCSSDTTPSTLLQYSSCYPTVADFNLYQNMK